LGFSRSGGASSEPDVLAAASGEGSSCSLEASPNHLLHLVGELDLQPRDVDPLGLCPDDAAAEQLELPL
jgi:hypothetical protein